MVATRSGLPTTALVGADGLFPWSSWSVLYWLWRRRIFFKAWAVRRSANPSGAWQTRDCQTDSSLPLHPGFCCFRPAAQPVGSRQTDEDPEDARSAASDRPPGLPAPPTSPVSCRVRRNHPPPRGVPPPRGASRAGRNSVGTSLELVGSIVRWTRIEPPTKDVTNPALAE